MIQISVTFDARVKVGFPWNQRRRMSSLTRVPQGSLFTDAVYLKTGHGYVITSIVFPVFCITRPWHNLNGCLATPPWEEGMGLLPDTKKLRVAHAPGMPRTFPSPPTSKETASYRFRHASRHVRHTLAMMHVGIATPRWRGKHSRRYRRICNPQFYVSGKRPIAGKINLLASALSLHNFCKLKRAQDKLHFNFLLDG